MKILNMGVIGCGPRAYGLIQTYELIAELKITALCDKHRPLAERAAASLKNSSVKVFTDHAEILRDKSIDVVFIAVEPENCADLVVQSLQAGKHVLSEVPMTYSIEDCWRIVLAVEQTGLKYQLAEETRYWPFIEKWRSLREEGSLGHIVSAEGEYLHGMNDDRFYLNPDTGERMTVEQANRHPNPIKTRQWNVNHPILYTPHELSPLLRVLDDRVVSTVCMGTLPPSKVREFLPVPDMETALMRTAKGTLLKISAGFTVHTLHRHLTFYHWYRVIGSKGTVETHRSDADKMKWLRDLKTGVPEEVWWDWDESKVLPEILATGHGGLDYYPAKNLVDAILRDVPLDMDVYRSAECAAPAIVAAESAEKGSLFMEVPDFRPSKTRKIGHLPEINSEDRRKYA